MNEYQRLVKNPSYQGTSKGTGGKGFLKFLIIAIVLGLLVGFYAPIKIFKKKIIKTVVV